MLSAGDHESAGRPLEPATAEDVGVHVIDRLSGLVPGVEHHPVAGVRDPLRLGHLPGLARQLVQETVPGLRHGGQVGVVLLGYNEYMRGCLRVNVPERKGALTFENGRCRHLSAHNLAEKTVGHRRNLNVQHFAGYCLRSVAPAAPAPRALPSRRTRTASR